MAGMIVLLLVIDTCVTSAMLARYGALRKEVRRAVLRCGQAAAKAENVDEVERD